MSSVDPNIQAKVSDLTSGYSPDIKANTSGKTGVAKAGQIVKNLKGKVSAQATRLMIRATTGVKVTNASIVDRVKKMEHEKLHQDTSEIVKLDHALQTVRVSKVAWEELTRQTNPEKLEDLERPNFDLKENEIKNLMKSNAAATLKSLEDSRVPMLSENRYIDPSQVNTLCDEIENQLANVTDLSQRAEILKTRLEPFEKANNEYYEVERLIGEFSIVENNLSSAQRIQLQNLNEDFPKIKNKFSEFVKLEGAVDSPLEKLRDELEYTEMLLDMQKEFNELVIESDGTTPKKPQELKPQEPNVEAALGEPLHPLEIKGQEPAHLEAVDNQLEVGEPRNNEPFDNAPPLKQAADEPLVENPAPKSPSKASLAARERALSEQWEQLESQKQALGAEKQEVAAAKQDLEARELKLKEDQNKLNAERKIIKDQAKLEADKRIAEQKRLEDKYVKDTGVHLKKEFHALAKFDDNYEAYGKHGSRDGGSFRKKYLDREVLNNFPALKSSHDDFQNGLQARNKSLHSRTREFMEQHPGKLNELDEVQEYKEHAQSYLVSKEGAIAHTKNYFSGRATSMPEKNPFAEFVLWQSEKDKDSDLAKVLSERLAESGSLAHQMLVADREDSALRTEMQEKLALRKDKADEDREFLEAYKQKFMTPLQSPPANPAASAPQAEQQEAPLNAPVAPEIEAAPNILADQDQP